MYNFRFIQLFLRRVPYWLLDARFLVAYFSTLKMDKTCSSKKSVDFPLLKQRDQVSRPQHICRIISLYTKNKQTPWPLVRERTIPTERISLYSYI
jgi:hypothetical protein